MDKQSMKELKQAFDDLLNYEAEDPLEPIDPITYRTPEGDSCLHIAAARGDLHSVKLLVEAGLDINQRGDMGNTPLHYATKKGHKNVVIFLLDRGASPGLVNEFGEKAIGS
ncbi:ankyrin repeat domain-containing protein [Thiobacillus sp.]|uniref:ankyrin repeat domain-containing protein n=1 Tax=Thiobacillus sp. TaxID=924 RepID=UPI00286E943D|nr:ankyrin repeat domain-containing protein [Thiobacillus sp.]